MGDIMAVLKRCHKHCAAHDRYEPLCIYCRCSRAEAERDELRTIVGKVPQEQLARIMADVAVDVTPDPQPANPTERQPCPRPPTS